jgi:hypothetical protein
MKKIHNVSIKLVSNQAQTLMHCFQSFLMEDLTDFDEDSGTYAAIEFFSSNYNKLLNNCTAIEPIKYKLRHSEFWSIIILLQWDIVASTDTLMLINHLREQFKDWQRDNPEKVVRLDINQQIKIEPIKIHTNEQHDDN